MDDTDLTPPSDEGILGELGQTAENVANAAENAAVGRIGEIQMIQVNSSDIAAWGYDPVNNRLQIQFTNARVYVYENIGPLEFEQLTLAESKGRAFWALIRRNPVGHPFTRLQ